MAFYSVDRVHRELSSSGGSHYHIAGVCSNNYYYPRQFVVDSINQGNTWMTVGGGRIRPITYCPFGQCTATPYITTRPDDRLDDNLENMPECHPA